MEALTIAPNLELPPARARAPLCRHAADPRFDEGAADLFMEGLVKGTAHSYVGEEAVAAGACAAAPGRLRRQLPSRPWPLHRQGRATERMMAELFGRETGYCRGPAARCTSPIWSSASSAPTASSAPASRWRSAQPRDSCGRRSGRLAFFGDGATNRASSTSRSTLPRSGSCRSSSCARTTSTRSAPLSKTTAATSVAARRAYGMPGVRSTATTAGGVRGGARRWSARERGGGPTLIEAMTYRWGRTPARHPARPALGRGQGGLDRARPDRQSRRAADRARDGRRRE